MLSTSRSATLAAIVAALALTAGQAAAADYRAEARKLPSYQKGSPAGGKAAKGVCGWLLYTVKQKRIGRRWSKPIAGFNLNRRVQLLDSCKFPKKSKWRSLERKLAKSAMLKRSGHPFKRGKVPFK